MAQGINSCARYGHENSLIFSPFFSSSFRKQTGKMKVQIVVFASLACLLAVLAEDAPAAGTEKVCEAGKEFTKDCNLCKCNEDGTAFACELKGCPEVQKVSEVTPETVAEDKCTPGELFKKKCNECKCPDSGLKSQAACTVIGCPDE